MSSVKILADSDVKVVLVGNRCDCDDSIRQVSTEEGKALAGEFKNIFTFFWRFSEFKND